MNHVGHASRLQRVNEPKEGDRQRQADGRQVLPVVMDAAVLSREAVLINAGRRGLMLKMSPLDIRAGLNCTVAEVSEA